MREIVSFVSQRSPVSRHRPPRFSPSITAFVDSDQANLFFLSVLQLQFEPDASTPQHSRDCTFCAVCVVVCHSGSSSTCDLFWSWEDCVKLHWRHMWRNFWSQSHLSTAQRREETTLSTYTHSQSPSWLDQTEQEFGSAWQSSKKRGCSVNMWLTGGTHSMYRMTGLNLLCKVGVPQIPIKPSLVLHFRDLAWPAFYLIAF